jgi:hypothetical protein
MKIFFMKCHGEGCPIAHWCVRYTKEVDNPNQVFQVPPYNPERRSCEAFEEVEPDPLKEINRISNYEEKRGKYPNN